MLRSKECLTGNRGIERFCSFMGRCYNPSVLSSKSAVQGSARIKLSPIRYGTISIRLTSVYQGMNVSLLFRASPRKRKKGAVFSLVTLGLIIAVALLLFWDLPSADALIVRSSPDTTKIMDRNGKLLFEILDPRAGRRTRVSLKDLPPYLPQAVLAVEDATFYENPGVDVVGIVRAVWQNLKAGTIVAGGSTITQQLARDLLLSKEERGSRSYARKLREAVLAVQLTRTYSKDEIMEMYLNEIYFGNLAYGIEAAAQTFFGKPARHLDLAESALLAGMIQSPAAYNPFVDADAAHDRQRVALGLMEKRGFITPNERQVAENENLHLASSPRAVGLYAPHFVAFVRNLLEQIYGPEAVNHGGMIVTTSLDLDKQERAEEIIRDQLEELRRKTLEEGAPDYNVHDAALVALDTNTGEILAMVGSADYFDEEIDGAVNVALSNRQPGSSIKPITYATAFAKGYTAATVLADVPTSFQTKEHQPYEPQNYDRAWHGPISLREALATSNNMIAVKVLEYVGVDAMVATAKALGISTFDDSERFGLALTLGGGEVKLLELTSAYAAFGNGGLRVTPKAILRVESKADSPTLGVPSCSSVLDCDADQVISPQIAYLITDILSDDSARIGAFGEESVLHLSHPSAAKTGTTTDFKDNWTVGYTPDLAVGVWVGNADNEPMYKISGITGAGPIWHDFMQDSIKGKPVRKFDRPDGLVEVEICTTSGRLPTVHCPRRISELYVTGTEPLLEDDTYRPIALDATTGLVWDDRCRGPRIEQVFRFLPAEAIDWARKQGIPSPPTMSCRGTPIAMDLGEGNVQTTSRPIEIIGPPANSIFTLTWQLPPEMQKIEVIGRLNVPTQVERVSLSVDGETIATFSSPPFRAFWSLSSGEHVVQAVGTDTNGTRFESDPVTFIVENSN